MPVCRLFPLALLALTACHAQVRQQDLDAWKGVSIDVLERHPLFASMPLMKRTLSDGGQLWNFQNCKTSPGEVIQGQYGLVIIPSSTACCSNQFLITPEGKVAEYRPVGACFTNESTQPEGARKQSRPAAPAPAPAPSASSFW